MASARRLTAQLLVDGSTLSGVVTDDEGRTRPFHGWLELIALLHAADDRHDDEAGDRSRRGRVVDRRSHGP
jgi:hypothetical protein